MALFRTSGSFEFPGPRDRTAIVGGTGSGKSVFGLWLIAEGADFHKKPYVLVDYKGEELIDELVARGDARLLKLDRELPKQPGLYVVKPDPQQQPAMAAWLWRVYRRGKIGLFFDELSMVPEYRGDANSGGPLASIYTQGRSKEIPVYGLVQRPVNVNLHTFAQAQFICAFNVAKLDDRRRVAEYIPDDVKLFDPRAKPLPNHWSRWWDDRRKLALTLKPSPPPREILAIFAARVEAMREREKL